MVKLVKDVKKGRIKSAYVFAYFDIAKFKLEANNYKIISVEQNAELRIQEGKDASVSTKGNRTREGFIWVPKEDSLYFTFNSLIMDSPSEATRENRKGRQFYIKDKQKAKALLKSVKINYNKESVPVKELHNDEVTAQIFGKSAQKYGEFLKDAGINEVPFWFFDKDYVKSQDGPFVTQLWFDYLSSRSGLGGSWCLSSSNGVRGVLENAIGIESKNLHYTRKDLRDVEREYNKLLKILQPNQIGKIGGLIEKLKQ